MKKLVLLISFFMTGCATTNIADRSYSASMPSMVMEPAPELMPAPPAPEPVITPSPSFGGDIPIEKKVTKDFVQKINAIKDKEFAVLLLTNKWYTKQKGISLCKNFVELNTVDAAIKAGTKREDQFITYWLTTEQIAEESQKNCEYLAQKYNFSEAEDNLDIIFHEHLRNLSWFKSIVAEAKIRGPYIAIYQGKDLVGLLDLGRLGPKSIEHLGKNWHQILNLAFKYKESKDPAAGIAYALNNVPGLKKKEREDILNNTILWSKAGLCVTLVAASVIAVADGGVTIAGLSSLSPQTLSATVGNIKTASDTVLTVAKAPMNLFFCKSVVDIYRR